MTNICFSIATPTRNSLDKLKRCVGSIRGQLDASHEHLIQDACSTDGTPDWLATQPGLAAVSERDQGMYDAINRAWARSSGDVLSWLNSDEQYLPSTLARVERAFREHPQVDVVSGNSIVVDPAGRAVALRREVPFRRRYVANNFLNVMSCTLFFRRRLLNSGLLHFNTRYRYAGDMDLMLRLAQSRARMLHLPDYLSLFGIDGSNLSTHSGMADETREIQLKYGGSHRPLVRQGWLVARRIERLLRGAYWPVAHEYRFALDETPHYQNIHAQGVGGRYSLNDADDQREVGSP